MWFNDSSSLGPFAARRWLHCSVLQLPHAKRRMISCWDEMRCKVPPQGCFTGYLHSRSPCQRITSAADLHPQGVTCPSPPPSSAAGLWAQLGCLWPLPCPVRGKKKKSLKQRVELAFVCLPCHHFESPRGGCVVPLSAAVTHQARHRSWEHRGVLTSGGKGHHDVHES